MHRRGERAKVRGDAHCLTVRRVDAVAYAGHVVTGGECPHAECAHVLLPALQLVQLTGCRDDPIGIQKIQCSRRAVHRQRVLFEEGGKPLHMIAVLVRDKDAVAVADRKAQRLERRRGGAHALAHIHDEVALTAAHHAAVAGRAGIQ